MHQKAEGEAICRVAYQGGAEDGPEDGNGDAVTVNMPMNVGFRLTSF